MVPVARLAECKPRVGREVEIENIVQNVDQFRLVAQGAGYGGGATVDTQIQIVQAVAGLRRRSLNNQVSGELTIRVGGHIVVGHFVVDPVLGLQGKEIQIDPTVGLPGLKHLGVTFGHDPVVPLKSPEDFSGDEGQGPLKALGPEADIHQKGLFVKIHHQ